MIPKLASFSKKILSSLNKYDRMGGSKNYADTKIWELNHIVRKWDIFDRNDIGEETKKVRS